MGFMLAPILRSAVFVGCLLLTAHSPIVVAAQVPGTEFSLTGDYLYDAAPDEVIFLSLVQSGTDVSGYTVLAAPWMNPGVEDPTASFSGRVEGTAEGGNVTLRIDLGLSETLILTGRKEGETLVLTSATDEGSVETRVFESATPEEFNQSLAAMEEIATAEATLWALLPTSDLVPASLVQSNEYGPFTVEEASGWFGGLGQGVVSLADWGWQAGVSRSFSDPDVADTGETRMIDITLYRFATLEGAWDALNALATGDLTEGLEEVTTESVADESRTYVGPAFPGDYPGGSQPEGIITRLYARSGSTLIIVFGLSDAGDPTPILIELVKRMLDPAYAESQAAERQRIFDLSTDLGARIDELYASADWLGNRIEDAQGDLEAVQSRVEQLESRFGQLRDEASRPMDCSQIVQVEASLGILEVDRSLVGTEREWFEATAEEIATELFKGEMLVVTATEISAELDAAIAASIYPAPFVDPWPGSQTMAVEVYESAAATSQADLDVLLSDYQSSVALADELMDDGQAIFTEASKSLHC